MIKNYEIFKSASQKQNYERYTDGGNKLNSLIKNYVCGIKYNFTNKKESNKKTATQNILKTNLMG